MNVQHRTSNVQHRMKKPPIPNVQRLFLFIFSHFDTRDLNFNHLWIFPFPHSTFDVGSSMFDVHFFIPMLMHGNTYRGKDGKQLLVKLSRLMSVVQTVVSSQMSLCVQRCRLQRTPGRKLRKSPFPKARGSHLQG